MRFSCDLPHGGNDERVTTVRRAIWPTLGDGLDLGPELHAFHAVLVGVTKGRAFPAAKAVISNRHGDRYVNADHADIDARGEFTGGVAIAGEDRDAIAILVL